MRGDHRIRGWGCLANSLKQTSIEGKVSAIFSKGIGCQKVVVKIRKPYPNQWLVIEIIEAHTTPNNQWESDHITVIDTFDEGSTA